MSPSTKQAVVGATARSLEAGFDHIQTSEDDLLEANACPGIGTKIKIVY